MLTPTQADARLRQAIVDHAVAHGLHDPGEALLDTWMVIAAWTPIDQGDDRRTAYSHQYEGGSVPQHIAIGLCHVVLDELHARVDDDL